MAHSSRLRSGRIFSTIYKPIIQIVSIVRSLVLIGSRIAFAEQQVIDLLRDQLESAKAEVVDTKDRSSVLERQLTEANTALKDIVEKSCAYDVRYSGTTLT